MSLLQSKSSFTKFDLTQEEWEEGTRLSSLQAAVIQNLICEAAEERIRLKFDPTKVVEFAQIEAELQGKIGILQYLLECSEASTSTNQQIVV